MSYLPCLNPNCKSHGKPHPNCRCYANMAEGGEAHFCSEARAHDPSCEYFADGGVAQSLPIGQDLLKSSLDEMVGGNPSDQAKWTLGHEDKEHAVASSLFHNGANHLLSGSMHGAYADNNLQKMANSKIEQKLKKYLAHPTKPLDKFASQLSSHPLAAPLLYRMLSKNETNGFSNLLSHLNNISRGSKSIDDGIESLFNEGSSSIESNQKDRDKLDKYLKDGKLDQEISTPDAEESFADGGDVSVPEKSVHSGSKTLANVLPEHNILIQAAKSRVNNYLNSLRPTEPSTSLPFDTAHEDPAKKRSYEKALDLAHRPANIFGLIKQGKLTAENLGHFKSLYPEVHDHLAKKMTERIVNAQLDKQKPDYHTRQAMSLFLGANLDSSLSPQSIVAAQSTFMPPQSPQAPEQGAKKKNPGKLKNQPNRYLTPEQASEMREQKT